MENIHLPILMEEKKKLNLGDYVIDTNRMYYFMIMPHGYGKRNALKEKMKKLQEKNKGEK